MKYQSTRSDFSVSPQEAILQGIAPDGGLYVYPGVSDVKLDVNMLLLLDTYDIAAIILNALLPGFENMRNLVERAYKGKFADARLTSLVSVGFDYALELFHGPTYAFKDVALCMLPQLMSESKKMLGVEEKIVILTATSGDTGKAALEGFKDVEGTEICVFYPDGGVSAVQQMQMITASGRNVHVSAVRGNFDDCQAAVKRAFTNLKKNSKLRLSSANSINIGRLAPQVVYYFLAYKQLLERGRIEMGKPVDFIVPTGNFGDILAGFYAKVMGLPVGRLVCASNANNVLTDFFRTGIYNKNREFFKTSSPSMDILVSSNLERLLYLASDCDHEYIRGLMEQLAESGEYKVNDKIKERLEANFWADWADEESVYKTIGSLYKNYGYLCDPHTAVAFAVLEKYKAQTKNPCVVLSTASPYKFPAAVLKGLGKSSVEDEYSMMDRLQFETKTEIPQNLKGLKYIPAVHGGVINKEDVEDYVVGLFKKNK
jgi:threonine synthase